MSKPSQKMSDALMEIMRRQNPPGSASARRLADGFVVEEKCGRVHFLREIGDEIEITVTEPKAPEEEQTAPRWVVGDPAGPPRDPPETAVRKMNGTLPSV